MKLSCTCTSKLEGLDDVVIPVEVESSSMCIHVKNGEGKWVQHTVCHRQYPITAAHVFTNYHSQGQTLPYVLIDIASLPSGTLNLFNLYVTLSRSSGWESIWLL
jgi:hypothetical protein